MQNDEKAMVEAVALHNPVSFAFEVTEDFMLYRKGIYSSTTCHQTPDKVNHAVLAVGYGEQDGVLYWIVKNSWGTQWGDKGYFLIERGKNMCGLAACASYPIPQEAEVSRWYCHHLHFQALQNVYGSALLNTSVIELRELSNSFPLKGPLTATLFSIKAN
ncbi:hypothetical protein U0070_024560 [Myodes glareolus]|uniref:Peptidase C1A papain C-terminal domain-containing protein n=1 Tax=Myodes glareolus TaxID=447135 RepID=A0AAW0I3M2_MYOGA